MISWADDDEAAFEASREWKATLVDEHYTDRRRRPAEIHANGEEVSDRMFKAMAIVSSDPDSRPQDQGHAGSGRPRSC